MSRTILFIFLSFMSFHALAEDVGTRKEYLTQVAKAVSVGILNAKVETACYENVDSQGGTYLADPEGCSGEVNSQLDKFEDIPELADYYANLTTFKLRNRLP